MIKKVKKNPVSVSAFETEAKMSENLLNLFLNAVIFAASL